MGTLITACEGCGQDMVDIFDRPVCMDCVQARARTAGSGRCRCGRKARELPPVGKAPRRVFVPCGRCLGVVRQLS